MRALDDLNRDLEIGDLPLDRIEFDEPKRLRRGFRTVVANVLDGQAGCFAQDEVRRHLASELLRGRMEPVLLARCTACQLAEVASVQLPVGMWQLSECPGCSE